MEGRNEWSIVCNWRSEININDEGKGHGLLLAPSNGLGSFSSRWSLWDSRDRFEFNLNLNYFYFVIRMDLCYAIGLS